MDSDSVASEPGTGSTWTLGFDISQACSPPTPPIPAAAYPPANLRVPAVTGPIQSPHTFDMIGSRDPNMVQSPDFSFDFLAYKYSTVWGRAPQQSHFQDYYSQDSFDLFLTDSQRCSLVSLPSPSSPSPFLRPPPQLPSLTSVGDSPPPRPRRSLSQRRQRRRASP